MAVDHIQETDTLNAGRVKINQAIDLSNNSSTKVDQFGVDLDQGIKDAKKIATDAGAEAKTIAETAGTEAKQAASDAATEAKTIATTAGNEAKTIAENAGKEANKKADQAVADSKTAVDNSNQAIGRANQNKQEFDALRNDFDDLVAESGDSNPEIVQARTDTQGVKQNTLQNRLTADFGTRLTNADAIQLFSGPVDVPKMMDFSGKVAGNTTANPHSVYTDYTATSLKKPNATWSEITQDNYNKLVGRDDQGVSTGSTQGSVIPQLLDKSDTVEAIEQLAPRIFEGMTIEEKVKYMKDNFISISLTVRAKASSPNNKNLKVALYLESTESYTTKIQGDATEYTDFTVEVNDSNFIDSKGFINVLVYSDSSNGVTTSFINVDYIGVQIKVSLNPLTVLNKSGFSNEADLALKADLEDFQEYVAREDNPHNVTAEQTGAYSKDDADNTFTSQVDAESTYVKIAELDKESVDLGNVDNYSTATQVDAETGTATNKFMTPKAVFQAIAKWVEGKFVGKTGDETISGLKKFDTSPNVQVNGSYQPVMAGMASYTFSASDIFQEYKTTITGAGGIVYRFGNICIVSVNISTKGATALTKALKLPEGFRLSRAGVYQVGLTITRNAEQNGYARSTINTDDNSAIRILTGDGSNYVTGVFVTDDPFPTG